MRIGSSPEETGDVVECGASVSMVLGIRGEGYRSRVGMSTALSSEASAGVIDRGVGVDRMVLT